MTHSPLFACCALSLLLVSAGAGLAQEDAEAPQAPIAFAGGQFTITQAEDYGEKTLSFDGREIAKNYVVYFDRIARVGGTDVALFDVGDGGNACGPARVMVWKPEGGQIESASIGQDDCGAPPAAVGDEAIYFVPWLMAGDTAPVKRWSPETGFQTAGNLTFAPEPGTGWKDVDASKYDSIVDSFRNEAVYDAAARMLGHRLAEVTTSLLVSAGTEKTPSGIIYASGCVPHDCGGNDGFMAIDAKGGKLYFARQGGKPQPEAWPALKQWPAELREAMKKAFAPPQ